MNCETSLVSSSASKKTYSAATLEGLWITFTALTVASLISILAHSPLAALFTAAGGLVIGCILLYSFWAYIQDGAARTTPGRAVGFSFIPFYGFYWWYVALVGLAKDFDRYFKTRHIQLSTIPEEISRGAYYLLLLPIPVAFIRPEFCDIIRCAGMALVAIPFRYWINAIRELNEHEGAYAPGGK